MYALHQSIKSKVNAAVRALLALLVVLAAGCDDPDVSEPVTVTPLSQKAESMNQSGKQMKEVLIIDGLTLDEDGNIVNPGTADPATLLYYLRTELPILAPDGHHVTAGEFSTVEGTAVAKCRAPGTQVTIHLSGLIPKAIYRIWIITFKEPGFNPTLPNPFVNITGYGSLGPNDRSRNTFRASASGKGTIVRFIPEGEFSEKIEGEITFAEDCLLTDVFEWHIFGAFQQPGQPHGPDVGTPAYYPNSAVEQFVFIFKQ